jgi:hypothetical protein
MSTFPRLGPLFEILFILALGYVLIRRKRTGRWKRRWSFPVAMVLLGLAIVLVSLESVLILIGR